MSKHNEPQEKRGHVTAPVAYVPVGAMELAADLRGLLHPRVGDAAVDFLDRLSDRPEGVPILRKSALERYGRFGRRGSQIYVWDVVKDALVSQGVVYEHPGYIVGARAKKYSLALSWRNRPLVRVRNPNGSRVVATGTCPVAVPPWLEYLVANASIDAVAATKYLIARAGIVGAEAQELAERGGFNEISAAVTKAGGQLVAAQVMNWLIPVWRWTRDKHTWTTRDPSGWRVHTPISNLPSNLRKFLRFPGRPTEPLVEIDATNSQAVFLAHVAHKELACAETLEFSEICGGGRFYEETYATVYGRDPTPGERSAWKERVMELWLYANLGCQVGSPAGRAIGSRFPKIHNWMGDLKAKHGTAYLPCRMQRAEAGLWVDALVPRLGDLGIPVFTVHDCAIVPSEHADAVKSELVKLYSAEGIQARLVLKNTD